MKVNVQFFDSYLEGDYGEIPGMIATCERCGYEVEVFGVDEPSQRYACAKLREECPAGETNLYTY